VNVARLLGVEVMERECEGYVCSGFENEP
jgi:hypothetical protein